MYRLVCALFFSLVSSFAIANEYEDADKAWAPGKPWPAHWGRSLYPYQEGWNFVFLAYVKKVYEHDEAKNTWLREIPQAMQSGASVEICMVKRGLFKLDSICSAALVEPSLIGTLKPEDVVAFFYPNHDTRTFFRKTPGSSARDAMRVFQKITSAGDESCWERRIAVFWGPVADSCFKKVDNALVEQILTRDFGPRDGAQSSLPATATAASAHPSVQAATEGANPAPNPEPASVKPVTPVESLTPAQQQVQPTISD